MWIVAIAWMYVAVMMSVAEYTSPRGTGVAALSILIFYGMAPTALVMYVLSTPRRRRLRMAKEAHEQAQADASRVAATLEPDERGLPTRDTVAAEGKEPR